MEFIKEYQQLIGTFIVTLVAGMGFVWGLVTSRHEKDLARVDRDIGQIREVLDDHESRLRTSAPQHEIDRLCDKVDRLKEDMNEAVTRGCNHNAETRGILVDRMSELERNLMSQFIALLNNDAVVRPRGNGDLRP